MSMLNSRTLVASLAVSATASVGATSNLVYQDDADFSFYYSVYSEEFVEGVGEVFPVVSDITSREGSTEISEKSSEEGIGTSSRQDLSSQVPITEDDFKEKENLKN